MPFITFLEFRRDFIASSLPSLSKPSDPPISFVRLNCFYRKTLDILPTSHLMLPVSTEHFLLSDENNFISRRQLERYKLNPQQIAGLVVEEVEMVGHRLNGHEFEQAPGDSEGQGSLVCCSPWGRKELDTTE